MKVVSASTTSTIVKELHVWVPSQSVTMNLIATDVPVWLVMKVTTVFYLISALCTCVFYLIRTMPITFLKVNVTVWIMISWLQMKPADQDPHCFFHAHDESVLIMVLLH